VRPKFRNTVPALLIGFTVACGGLVFAADSPAKSNEPAKAAGRDADQADSVTDGVVTVNGHQIAYTATAGVLTVGSTDTQDASLSEHASANGEEKSATPRAHMFYVAYVKKDGGKDRPITFLYNGGPGSSTAFLHMFALGPRRVVVPDPQAPATPGAPYRVVNNDFSLLDQSDLVFIDAPGTGFGRLEGEGKEKAFWGSDADAHAFGRFIRRYLTRYGRWSSPKYLLGESYGTLRTAQLAAALQDVSLSGIVMVSQLLNFTDFAEAPHYNPGADQAYALLLPSMAAVAFYHHKLPNQPASLQPFLVEVEQYALGEYMSALLQGSDLSAARRDAVAAKLHEYTGLPVSLLLKSDLRIRSGVFTKNLFADDEQTIGTLDGRFRAADLDPLAGDADNYDPLFNALVPAASEATNDYLRGTLKYNSNLTYELIVNEVHVDWNWRHEQPGKASSEALGLGNNVMPDLAFAMKLSPRLKVMVTGGYFDLGTPFFGSLFEMHHLPIPQGLQSNIAYHYYPAGHMFYLNDEALRQFHGDLATFIEESGGHRH
jgi:carboxypeptidase C (cathepsin A)